MEECEVIHTIEEVAEGYCQQYIDDPSLWETHTQLVRAFAVKLARIEGADVQVVEIAALLHDAGKYQGREDHHLRSVEIAADVFQTLALAESKKHLILKCIAKHRTQFAHENDELEVKIIQSADVLGTLFDDAWQTHSRQTIDPEMLRRLYHKVQQKIRLESARQIALPHIQKLERLLDEYRQNV